MLLKLFEKIPDKRRKQAQKYDLSHLLLYSLLGLLAGCNTYKDMELYIRIHLEELNKYFGSNRERSPAHSTINYFFITLTTDELEKVFREHAKKLCGEKCEEGQHLAFDGKVLRGSYDNAEGIPALQMITSYLVTHNIILSHEFIEGQKTNEIPVVQDMVKELGLRRAIVTADALHCQKKH